MRAGKETEGQKPPEVAKQPQLTALLAKDLDPAKVALLLHGTPHTSGNETIVYFTRLNRRPTYLRVINVANGSRHVFAMLRGLGGDVNEQDVTSNGMVMGTDALDDPLLMFIEPPSEQGMATTALLITEHEDSRFKQGDGNYLYPEIAQARDLALEAQSRTPNS